MTGDVLIVTTGVANLASIRAAFGRLGMSVRLGDDPGQVRDAERVVVPGVGSFGAAMARLEALGLVSVLRDRVAADLPTLAVCVGLQVLCASSDESPGVAGIGVVPGAVRRFGEGVRVPQFGWNRVQAPPDARFLQSGFAYFANSYRLQAAPADWLAATSEHGGPFVAAIERGRVLACQFHPELSGNWGLSLLERWGRATARGGAGC